MMALLFHVQCFLHKLLNLMFNPLGLYVTWLAYFNTLEELSDAFFDLEKRALIDRMLLLHLLAERVEWDIDWIEGEETFTVKIPDEPVVEYPQDLEHIDKVLADVKFLLRLPLPQIASQEVQA